jgi:hypothetical protein
MADEAATYVFPFRAVLPFQAREGVPLQPGVSGHPSSPRFVRRLG